jgi:hypothetical protein
VGGLYVERQIRQVVGRSVEEGVSGLFVTRPIVRRAHSVCVVQHSHCDSIHVEIALEDALLHRVGLGPRGMGGLGLDSSRLLGRSWHLGDGFGPIMEAVGLARRRSVHARGKGRTGARDAALSAGSKLLGPVIGLVGCAGARAAGGAHVTHGLGAKAHATDKGRGGGGAGQGLLVIDGILINRVGIVGGDAAPAVERGGGSRRRAAQADGGHRETAARVPARHAGHGIAAGALRGRVAPLEEVGEGGRGDRGATLAGSVLGRTAVSVVGHGGNGDVAGMGEGGLVVMLLLLEGGGVRERERESGGCKQRRWWDGGIGGQLETGSWWLSWYVVRVTVAVV